MKPETSANMTMDSKVYLLGSWNLRLERDDGKAWLLLVFDEVVDDQGGHEAHQADIGLGLEHYK